MPLFALPPDAPALLPASLVLPCPVPRCPIGRSRRLSRLLRLAVMAGLASITADLAPAAPSVSAKRDGGQIMFSADGREMFRYHAEPAPLPRPDIRPEFQRGGYVFPLLTPSGALVADDYPPNHIHHHGLWWAWTKTKFGDTEPDFWNMGQKTGRVEFVALDRIEEKNGAAHLTARHRFVSLLATPPAVVLEESWELTARAIDENRPRHVLDLTSTQTCASTQPLLLPTYHYGGLGFRGRREWDGAQNCQFLTSEGISDRIQGNTSTARWLWIGGKSDTASLAGLAILSHPSNFRAPQPLRLHPTEPFVCFAPQQAGPMEITPGKPYVSRYRLVIADGQPSRDEIEDWWKEFAAEATPDRPD